MEGLPKELQNNIFYYCLEHPVAKLFKEYYFEELGLEPDDEDNFATTAFKFINIGSLFCDSCRCWLRTKYEMVGNNFFCEDCLDEVDTDTDLDDED